MTYSIRVRAKSNPEEWRTITVSDDGTNVECDCAGFDGAICSHIDAVLIAGERAMVWPGDEAMADRAAPLVCKWFQLPDYWRGSWRREFDWRGISREQRRKRVYKRKSNKPLVCFTGKFTDYDRDEMKADARTHGWDVVDSPSAHLDVLVAADPMGPSAKLKKARANAIPIITVEEWGR
ncbi:MAG: BRCT domain-containing protein [Caenibius sp.]